MKKELDPFQVTAIKIMYDDGSEYNVTNIRHTNAGNFNGLGSKLCPKQLIYTVYSADNAYEVSTEYQVDPKGVIALHLKYDNGNQSFIRMKPCAVAKVDVYKRYKTKVTK